VTPTFHTLPERTETARLKERLARLRASLEWAGEAIDPAVRDDVRATIARCDERLALGVDHTVVALAGGTGSGKSSLFNALTGSQFAVPGVARPTTAHLSAASWGQAGPLLDWLDVAHARRLLLPADAVVDTGEPLAGVVLLDLPDHDSVNAANRATVDRVVPLVDLIVWVVDPQKYADHALHDSYLSQASDHGQPSLVVLNQVDRLGDDDAVAVAQDLARLVHAQGIADVPVLLASARTGRGVQAVLREVAQAAGRGSVAAEAVRADLVAAGRALARALARDAEPVLPDVELMVAALARAAGVDARADAVAAAVAGRSQVIPEVVSAPAAAVEQIRLEWVDGATAGLPVAWRTVVDDAVVAAPALAAELAATFQATDWPGVPRVGGVGARWRRARMAGAAAQATRATGLQAVRAVVGPRVVEPTVMIHQAYRALDELTELD